MCNAEEYQKKVKEDRVCFLIDKFFTSAEIETCGDCAIDMFIKDLFEQDLIIIDSVSLFALTIYLETKLRFLQDSEYCPGCEMGFILDTIETLADDLEV